jgi:hypothetical protein
VNVIDLRLARQNVTGWWMDCSTRRPPRPHRFVVEQEFVRAGRRIRYERCTRCPVSVRYSYPE